MFPGSTGFLRSRDKGWRGPTPEQALLDVLGSPRERRRLGKDSTGKIHQGACRRVRQEADTKEVHVRELLAMVAA